jgi:copper chaperone CopZ
MRRSLLVFTTALLIATTAYAGTIRASVNGLVCSFCATGLEKTFGKEPAIASIHVDLEKKLVSLTTKPKQDIDDATVTRLITDAGFTVTDIKRSN